MNDDWNDMGCAPLDGTRILLAIPATHVPYRKGRAKRDGKLRKVPPYVGTGRWVTHKDHRERDIAPDILAMLDHAGGYWGRPKAPVGVAPRGWRPLPSLPAEMIEEARQ